MYNTREFRFLITVLEKQHIKHHLIPGFCETPPEFDLGLRKLLYPDADYASYGAQILRYAKPNTIFRFQDEFLCKYYFILLPEETASELKTGKTSQMQSNQSVIFGPFLATEITDSTLLELTEQMHLQPIYYTHLKKYYSIIPIVPDEDWMFSLLTSFGEYLWNGSEQFHIEDIKHSLPDTLEPITVRPNFFEPEEALLTMQVTEERYKTECEFMKAVAQGLTHKAVNLMGKNSFFQMEKRLHNPVRDMKNYCIVLNTLLRKAAENGGVHPIHLDSISSRYARRIEMIVSPKEGISLQKEMIHKYCLLVKNHSIRGYSPIIQKILTRIDADLTADLSLGAHAALLNVNSSYLSTIFKKEVGMTLTDYVTKKRIEQAIFLLNTTSLQIQTIAQHCGMPDVNYFTKTFKKLIGKTPKEYRKSIL